MPLGKAGRGAADGAVGGDLCAVTYAPFRGNARAADEQGAGEEIGAGGEQLQSHPAAEGVRDEARAAHAERIEQAGGVGGVFFHAPRLGQGRAFSHAGEVERGDAAAARKAVYLQRKAFLRGEIAVQKDGVFPLSLP